MHFDCFGRYKIHLSFFIYFFFPHLFSFPLLIFIQTNYVFKSSFKGKKKTYDIDLQNFFFILKTCTIQKILRSYKLFEFILMP